MKVTCKHCPLILANKKNVQIAVLRSSPTITTIINDLIPRCVRCLQNSNYPVPYIYSRLSNEYARSSFLVQSPSHLPFRDLLRRSWIVVYETGMARSPICRRGHKTTERRNRKKQMPRSLSLLHD